MLTAGGVGRPSFETRLLEALTKAPAHFQGNIDPLRFPSEFSVSRRIRRSAAGVARRLLSLAGFRERLSYGGRKTLTAVLQDMASYSEAYSLLADGASRETMVELLAYRILGWNQIMLSRNNEEYWAKAVLLEGFVAEKCTHDFGSLGWGHLYDMGGAGFGLRLHAHPLSVLLAFLLEQYRLTDDRADVDVKPGDLVIDAGGGGGDTALYFAHRVGSRGRVVSFEFAPTSARLFSQNLGLNPELARNISVVPLALWHESGKALHFSDNALATRVGTELAPSSLGVQTTTLDEYVARNNLGRVDFLKMDIEGAELNALRGATETIRRDRPRLAISAYHRLDDLAEFPRFLAPFGYRLFLQHTTIFDEETVLFGCPD
jgi:FkbM family methyltransferase